MVLRNDGRKNSKGLKKRKDQGCGSAALTLQMFKNEFSK